MTRLPRPQFGKWIAADINQWMRVLSERLMWTSFTWNPPNVPASSTVDTTLTTTDADLTGLRVGMVLALTPPSGISAGIVIGPSWVATSDTITIRLINVTALDINPASGAWSVVGWLVT